MDNQNFSALSAAERRERTVRNPAPTGARWRELIEGEVITGRVVRMPAHNLEAGTRLFLDTGEETIAIPASAKKGHTVLERELERQNVSVGSRVRIVFRGWRETQDGARRRYRFYTVEVAP